MTAHEAKNALYRAGLTTCKGVDSDLVPTDLALCYAFFESKMLQKRVEKLMADRVSKGVKWSQLSSFSSRYVGAKSNLEEKQVDVEQVKKDIVEIEFSIEKSGLSKRDSERLPGRLSRKKDKLVELQKSVERAEIENEFMQSIAKEVGGYKLNQKGKKS